MLRYWTTRSFIRYFSTSIENALPKVTIKIDDEVTVPINEQKSVLDSYKNEDISHIAPYLKPTFNFAAYINKSETLQELLKLGVNLHQLEKTKDVPSFILGLNFSTDIKNHIIFLHELGLDKVSIGQLITSNPFIFKEDLDNLNVRINYLKSKKFSNEAILRIVGTNPFWLTHSTQDIDEKLGFFQNYFELTGSEIRYVTAKKPKLITFEQEKIKLNTFVIKEEMGFSEEEVKKILLNKPGIFMKNQNSILKTFEYFHKDMKISLDRIVESPEILTCRHKRLRVRHLFLEKLGRAQYNPRLENYVALTTLVAGTDSQFCTEAAKSSIQAFNEYLKTM